MKKVLMVSCDGLGRGGVQTVIMNTVDIMQGECQFDILLFTEENRYYDNIFESYGGKIYRFPHKKGKINEKLYPYNEPYRIYKKIEDIIKQNGGYDIVHCQNETESGFCLKAAKKMGVPIRITHTHVIQPRSHFIWNSYLWICRKFIKKYTTHKIGGSTISCIKTYGKDQDWRVINNPYDSDRFVFAEKGQGESPVFTQIGSFSDNKNQLFSLEVFAKVRETYPEAIFNLIGFDSGHILSEIRAKIERLGLSENVFIHPHDADSPKILAQSDYFLFPSKVEGFGIVAVEAQAVGVKVFASDTVTTETNCGGVTYLPLSEGVDFWAEKIIEDFKVTKGGHQKYDCSRFSKESIVQEYRKLYEIE